MRSLEARIAALEQLTPAPGIAFVANYRPDGTLRPLPRGKAYGRQVALMPAAPPTVEEWVRLYVGRPWHELKAIQDRAQSALEELTKSSRFAGGSNAGGTMR